MEGRSNDIEGPGRNQGGHQHPIFFPSQDDTMMDKASINGADHCEMGNEDIHGKECLPLGKRKGRTPPAGMLFSSWRQCDFENNMELATPERSKEFHVACLPQSATHEG